MKQGIGRLIPQDTMGKKQQIIMVYHKSSEVKRCLCSLKAEMPSAAPLVQNFKLIIALTKKKSANQMKILILKVH